MNRKELIERLLALRGMSKVDLATALGVPYDSLLKTITPTPWFRRNGEKKYRECLHVREKIADWIGLPPATVWGEDFEAPLKKTIAREAASL